MFLTSLSMLTCPTTSHVTTYLVLKKIWMPLTLLLKTKIIYCNIVSMIYLSTNLDQQLSTKHIEVDIHFVCEMVALDHVSILKYLFHITVRKISSTQPSNQRASEIFKSQNLILNI